jgi:hypothetical protein
VIAEGMQMAGELNDDPQAGDTREDRRGTNERWKRPGQASQDPSLKSPPTRERDDKDNKTA